MAANGWIGGEWYEDGQIVEIDRVLYIAARPLTGAVLVLSAVKSQITHGPVKKRGKGKVKRW